MTEVCDSSGLHSLASLREHEKRRAQQQAEAARARAEVEQRARKEAERVATRIEHERKLAERAALESAQRSQQVLLETAQRAEFERAEGLRQASAELKLRLERECEARQRLELGLTSQLLRQRLLTSASLALCVGSWLAAAGLYFGALQPRAERMVATAEQALLTERRAHADAREKEARSLHRADEQSLRVAILEATLREERERRATPPPTPGATRKPFTTREPRIDLPVKPCRDDGDPLNPCLKR